MASMLSYLRGEAFVRDQRNYGDRRLILTRFYEFDDV